MILIPLVGFLLVLHQPSWTIALSFVLFAHLIIFWTFYLMCFCQILLSLPHGFWPISLSHALSATNIDHMFHNVMDTIVFSKFHGVFVFPHFEDVSLDCLHIDLTYAFTFIYVCCANGVITKNGHVLHDMLLYFAHTWFAWSLMCRSYLWMSLHELLQPRIPMTEDLARRAHRHLAKVTSERTRMSPRGGDMRLKLFRFRLDNCGIKIGV